jgi:hypothetical protein
MVERQDAERDARADASLRRENRDHRRDRGEHTEDDCGAKTAIHAAHDAYGVAVSLSRVKLRIQVRLRYAEAMMTWIRAFEFERW